MSNPRRFGSTTLYRVTERLTLAKAKRVTSNLQKSGLRARVDTYQGAYAVWSVEREIASTVETRVRTKSKGLITLYHGTTSSALSRIRSGKVVLGWWTTLIDKAAIYAISMHTKENAELSKQYSDIPFSRGYPIILVCRVPTEWFWEAHGDQSNISQPNMPSQTLSIKYLIGCYHYKNYKVLNSVDEEFGFTRSHWIKNKSFVEKKSYVPKQKPDKIITLYHGTTSKNLSKIRKTGKVIGYWTTDLFDATRWAVMFIEEKPVSKYGYPIILVTKVSESQIIWDSVPFHAHGFKWKGGLVENPIGGHGSGMERTAMLPAKMVTQVLHYKSKSDINPEWMDFINEDLNKRDWTRKKL